jgi:hypothetical protein
MTPYAAWSEGGGLPTSDSAFSLPRVGAHAAQAQGGSMLQGIHSLHLCYKVFTHSIYATRYCAYWYCIHSLTHSLPPSIYATRALWWLFCASQLPQREGLTTNHVFAISASKGPSPSPSSASGRCGRSTRTQVLLIDVLLIDVLLIDLRAHRALTLQADLLLLLQAL